MAHRIRSQSIATKISLVNQLHAHFHEFGFVIRKGRAMWTDVHRLMENELPPILLYLVNDLLVAIRSEEERIATLDKRIQRWAKSDAMASKLMQMDGVGALTASAVIATARDPGVFKNGRHFVAWLGLVARQNSSGGKTRLRGITKRGDRYLRTLLIHGDTEKHSLDGL